jgi:hypothetical protein
MSFVLWEVVNLGTERLPWRIKYLDVVKKPLFGLYNISMPRVPFWHGWTREQLNMPRRRTGNAPRPQANAEPKAGPQPKAEPKAAPKAGAAPKAAVAKSEAPPPNPGLPGAAAAAAGRKRKRNDGTRLQPPGSRPGCTR